MSNLHDLIDRNCSHHHYGRLLQHRDRHNSNIFHYSVQLNDRESLAWEPIHGGKEKDTGRLAIWPIDWEHFHPVGKASRNENRSHHRERALIDQALHVSVHEFHENWQYELYRFNCEHWARLVSTGDCICYQISEVKKLKQIPVLGVLIVGAAGIVTGAWDRNGYAQEVVERAAIAAY